MDQAARRRLSAAYAPTRPGGARELPDGSESRWTTEFFAPLRTLVLPRMSEVEPLDGATLRYFGAGERSLWALHHEHALVLALDHGESPEQIREHARRWLSCLRTRTAPGLASPHWGHPVYGARLDPANGELDVVWAVADEWLELVPAEGLGPREADLPVRWLATTAV